MLESNAFQLGMRRLIIHLACPPGLLDNMASAGGLYTSGMRKHDMFADCHMCTDLEACIEASIMTDLSCHRLYIISPQQNYTHELHHRQFGHRYAAGHFMVQLICEGGRCWIATAGSNQPVFCMPADMPFIVRIIVSSTAAL